MTEAHNRLLSIFGEALACSSAPARAAYLAEACGADEELRARVAALLRAHEEAGGFLGGEAEPHPSAPLSDPDGGARGSGAPAPDVSTAPQPPITERPEAVIGPYQLLQQLGEGGMGTVWVAKQTEPVQRKVALKLIKAGMDSRAVLARFEQERQALALMDHPNIAKVFDAGVVGSSEPRTSVSGAPQPLTDVRGTGTPYFVMELVNGLPLTRFCDEGKLTPRERLELFVPICQAVQHAHQKGIVHRDLKPSNILVTLYDGKPVPKIIDFGVAKAIAGKLTDETLSTQFGAVIGTLEYMAPEQAGFSATDVDTRADIYSLGVILYELLTGLRPFDRKRLRSAAYDEMVRIIRKEEPQRPSDRLSTDESRPSLAALRRTEPKRLAALLRSELDWVVMKCLEKDRNRRYETASGLAREIQRYLSDEPVEARPPSAAYRLRKFARRNKAVLLTVAFVALALVAGTVVSAWQAVRATQAEKLAEKRLESERDARHEAEQAGKVALANFARARDVVHRMLTRVAEERVAGVPWMEPVRKALLEDAIQFYEQLLAERNTDPEVRLATAWAHIRLSWVYSRFQDGSRREPAIRRALHLLEPLVKEHPNEPRYRTALASCLRQLGHLHLYDSRSETDPEAPLRKAVELWEGLVSANPDSVEYQLGLAGTLLYLGRVVQNRDEKERVWRRALTLFEGCEAKAGLTHDHHGFLGTLSGLASLMEQTDPREAEAMLLRGVAVRARIEKVGGALWVDLIPTANQLEMSLAALYQTTGRPQDAEAAYRRAVDTIEKHVASYPGIRMNHYHASRAHQLFGHFLFAERRFKEAEAEFRRGWRLSEDLISDVPGQPGPDWWNKYLSNVNGLAAALRAQGRNTDAAEVLRQSQEFCARLAEKHPAAMPDDLRFHQLLGSHYAAKDQQEKAIAAYSKAIELNKTHYARWSNRGDAYGMFGQWPLAAADYAKAVELSGAPPVVWYRHALLRLAVGDTAGYRQASAVMLERFHLSSNMDDIYWVAWTCLLGPDAVTDWKRPVELAEKAQSTDPKNYDKLNTLGGLLVRAGRFEEAARRLAEAEAAFQETQLPRGSIVYNWLFQAVTQHRLGQVEEAKRWFRKAVNEIDQPPPESSKDAAATMWNRRLTLELLRREAEELLKK